MTTPVRYYGRPIDPMYFKKRGFRGRWILLLHGVAMWLQRRIEYHVMLFIAGRQGFTPEAVNALKLTFQDENDKAKSDPRKAQRRSKLAAFGIPTAEESETRADKYAEGRKNSDDKSDPLRDPASIQATIARLSQTGRASRYTGGRNTYTVQDLDVNQSTQQENSQ